MADMHKQTEAPVSQESPSRHLDKIVIRVPNGLRERIAAAAKKSKRSVNAELVDLLEMYYPELTPADVLIDNLKRIIKRMESMPNEELNDGFRAYLSALLREAFDNGVFRGEGGFNDFQRQIDKDAFVSRIYEKQINGAEGDDFADSEQPQSQKHDDTPE